jgi:hypothetical protein
MAAHFDSLKHVRVMAHHQICAGIHSRPGQLALNRCGM